MFDFDENTHRVKTPTYHTHRRFTYKIYKRRMKNDEKKEHRI